MNFVQKAILEFFFKPQYNLLEQVLSETNLVFFRGAQLANPFHTIWKKDGGETVAVSFPSNHLKYVKQEIFTILPHSLISISRPVHLTNLY